MSRLRSSTWRFLRCSFTRVVLCVWLGVIVWNQYLQFVVMSFRWASIHSTDTSVDRLHILFVADPQLIGVHDKEPLSGPVAIWDADNYLSTSFRLAYNHVQPDVVVFLGDLLDEGSTATPDEYQSYLERFSKIFYVPENVQRVYLPGDNDIGGEGFDSKTPEKLAAFNQHFLPHEISTKDVINVKFLDFIKLSLMPQDVAAAKLVRDLDVLRQHSTAMYRILCNHVSIIDRTSNDQNEIIKNTAADLIFTAHSHYSNILACNDCGPDGPGKRDWNNFSGRRTPVYTYQMYHFDLKNKQPLYEIQVPTCSYRMGVYNMGYGAAQIDKNGHVKYTVLWLPERYKQLISYIVLVVVTCISILLWVCVKTGGCDNVFPCC